MLNSTVLFTRGDIFVLISKIENFSGHQWLMPVILATQEAEFRRIAV
jgi:hypothetical protein